LIDDVLADIDQIIRAEREGRLQTVGNWKPGQILAHVAAWIEYGYSGYPIPAPAWPIRLLIRSTLGRTLKKGMPSGIRIPNVPGGTTGQDDVPLEAAAERLKTAFLKLKNNEPCSYDSPAFGHMSHADRIRLNLRHAELHLSHLK
jgi:hypothetical protein